MNTKEKNPVFVPEDTSNENQATQISPSASVSIKIPEETLQEVINMADDQVLWMKPTQFGFSYGDKVVPEIRGAIVQVNPYLVKFDGKQAIKKPHVSSDHDIPEGFERRCDIKLDAGAGQIVGVSLSKSSFRGGLAPYLKYLNNQGLKPHEVLTVMRTRIATNQYGQFAVVNFAVADETSSSGSGQSKVAQQPLPQTVHNPWA